MSNLLNVISFNTHMRTYPIAHNPTLSPHTHNYARAPTTHTYAHTQTHTHNHTHTNIHTHTHTHTHQNITHTHTHQKHTHTHTNNTHTQTYAHNWIFAKQHLTTQNALIVVTVLVSLQGMVWYLLIVSYIELVQKISINLYKFNRRMIVIISMDVTSLSR